MTLTFAVDLDSVTTNQHAKGQGSFSSKVVGPTDTRIPDLLLYTRATEGFGRKLYTNCGRPARYLSVGTRLYRTCDGQSERVVGRPRVERDDEASSGLERFEHAAHHVHLRLLVTLSLAPPDRVVEQVEPTVGREVAVQSDRLA